MNEINHTVLITELAWTLISLAGFVSHMALWSSTRAEISRISQLRLPITAATYQLFVRDRRNEWDRVFMSFGFTLVGLLALFRTNPDSTATSWVSLSILFAVVIKFNLNSYRNWESRQRILAEPMRQHDWTGPDRRVNVHHDPAD